MTRRRNVVVGLLGGTVVVGVWLAGAAVELRRAQADLRAGANAVEEARGRTGLAEIVAGEPVANLQDAHARFRQAHRRVTSPLLFPIRLAPVGGRQLRSVQSLSAAATEVTDVALDALTAGQALLAPTQATNSERARLAGDLGALARRTRERLAAVDLGPDQGLFGPLAEARDRLATELADLDEQLGRAVAGAATIADLLTGPSRYLVFAANNAEMRAGSGMFLSVGELVVDDAGLHLGEMRSVVDVRVPAGAVPVEGDLAERWGWLAPNQEWRNLMTSPRFDESAALAARMWPAAGHRPVDGVLALDPVALSGLLEATGPVTIDGRTVDAATVVGELLHGQYVRYAGVDRDDRREELGRIAGAVFQRLDRGQWSMPDLAAGLARAAAGRHLMAWSSDPPAQAGWVALGVDGGLGPESVLVSVVNRGGNKLDQFLQVSSDLAFASTPTGTQVTLTLTLHNGTPAGEPPYVAGDDPSSGVPPRTYLGIVTVNLPGAATGGRIEGVDRLAVAGADGATRVVGTQLRVDPAEARTVVVRFTVPLGHPALRLEPSARVPAVVWTGAAAGWDDRSSLTVPLGGRL